ncbi:MAG: carbohydrate ABC transporter permease, partial [Methanosarcinales archaeon]
WNLYVAIHDVKLINILKSWNFVGFNNFIDLFHDTYFFESLKVSLFFVGGSVTFQLIVGLLLALLINQKIRGAKTFRVIFIIPWILSAVIVGFSWRWMYHDLFGLINYSLNMIGLQPIGWLTNPNIAIWSIVITDSWYGTPFTMLFLGAALMSIPDELYEAAAVDGASKWQSFRYITLPHLKPFIAINLILITMWTVNIFELHLVMTGGGPLYSTTTTSLYMYRKAFEFGHISIGACLGFILFGINMIAAYFYVKSMRQ